MAKRAKPSMFRPETWQWSPESVTSARVQFWSAGGSMSIVDLSEARKLIKARAAFAGSEAHICQVHERIDGANA